MESMKSPAAELLVGVQEPRIRVTPPAARNDAADVVEMAACYGLTLDPWQVAVFEAGLGLDDTPGPGGRPRWASSTVCTACPRQNGKGTIIEALLLAAAFLFEEEVIACSAHESRTTRVSFERVLGYLENYDDLRSKVASVQRWVGREQIRLRSGQLLIFPARSRGALRGYSVNRMILDEAQFVQQSQLEATLPTMSARPNTQQWLFGTPPTALGDGEVFNRLRAQALSGRAARTTWLEWSAEPDCDLDDPRAYAQANPALGRRISLAAVQAERAALSDQGFRRERLGIFDVSQVDHIFGGPEVWPALAAPRRDDVRSATALAVDRSHDGLVAVVGCFRDFDSGRSHLEVVFLRDQMNHLGALVAWLLDNTTRQIPIAVDAMSPAAVLVGHLQNKRNIVVTNTSELARSCVGFADDVMAGMLSHGDTPNGDLAAAVEGARKRPIGDAGAWGWDRRDGSVSISPLVSASLSHFAAVAYGRPRRTGEGRMASGRVGFVM
jgi:hypothetical protein